MPAASQDAGFIETVIRIRYLLEGARAARGSVVIVDVFRTTSLVATLFARGIGTVIPALTARQARGLRSRYPDALLIGGRLGTKLLGFDSDISPTRLRAVPLAGRTAIITGTNGTRGILNAKAADEVILGSFLNARAVARYLETKEDATIVAIGEWYGRRRAVEDDCCAELIYRYATGQRADSQDLCKRAVSSVTSRVRSVVQREDVSHCLSPDLYDLVPRYRDGVITVA